MESVAPAAPKKRMRVDLAALEEAFGDLSFETHYYLDRKTGGVPRIDGAIRRALEEIYEELNRAGDGNLNRFGGVVRKQARPEDERQALFHAHEIESGLGGRYTPLPPAHPHLGVRDMEDFVATVDNPLLKDELLSELCKPDHERRFTETLAHYPADAERWLLFRRERVRGRVRYWLEEEGIEPI